MTLFADSLSCEQVHTVCPTCNGKGIVENPRHHGMRLRQARKKARIGLRQMATRLQISAPYLHDLEMGRRNWNQRIETFYLRVVEAAQS